MMHRGGFGNDSAVKRRTNRLPGTTDNLAVNDARGVAGTSRI
jgi:hypothetical protein